MTAVLTLTVGYIRDGRTRRWFEQDRDQQAKDTVAQTTKLTDHASLTAAGLRELALEKAHKLEIDLIRIGSEVAEAKEAAGAAYKEANHVNLKISEYNRRLLEARTERERLADLEVKPTPITSPVEDPPP